MGFENREKMRGALLIGFLGMVERVIEIFTHFSGGIG